jgi:hypothetical protein
MGQGNEADRKAALKWAEARAREIRAELDSLYSFFPELRGQVRVRAASGSPDGRRKRRPPTAAERKKISQGMRKLWARRRAERGKQTKQAS